MLICLVLHLIVVMCIYVPYGLIIEKPLCSTLLFPTIKHLGLCTAYQRGVVIAYQRSVVIAYQRGVVIAYQRGVVIASNLLVLTLTVVILDLENV